jgi:hypothetical protein
MSYDYREGDLVSIPSNTTIVQLSKDSNHSYEYVSAVRETNKKLIGIVKNAFDGTYCKVMIIGEGLWNIQPRHLSYYEGEQNGKASRSL